MTYNSNISHNYQQTSASLQSIRLTPCQLAEARFQLARAEAIADLVYRAWTAFSSVTRHVGAAIARRSAALVDAYAESAMHANMDRRDRYLAQATDVADLERRFRSWQSPRYAPHLN
jgi:hypothetical protein